VFNWETLGAVIHNGHGVQLVVFCTTWAVSRILAIGCLFIQVGISLLIESAKKKEMLPNFFHAADAGLG